MAGKGSGLSGKTECRASQRLPGGPVSKDAIESGGGTRTRDAKESRSMPEQAMPRGFNEGGQGEYPHGPLTTHNYHGVSPQPNQHLPSGHFEDGLSAGKAGGATRGADAYQGPREGESK